MSRENLDFGDLMRLQDALQEKYKGIWESITPDRAQFKILWMMEEVGEVIAILKKRGPETVMTDLAVREHFLEEMGDILMYYTDILQCLRVTPEEFSAAYLKKHRRNMERDFPTEHSSYLMETEKK